MNSKSLKALFALVLTAAFSVTVRAQNQGDAAHPSGAEADQNKPVKNGDLTKRQAHASHKANRRPAVKNGAAKAAPAKPVGQGSPEGKPLKGGETGNKTGASSPAPAVPSGK
jgi:hypothetical protein